MSKEILMKLIERENEYLAKQEVGSKEYNESIGRLGDLEGKLFEIEKFEDGKKDRLRSGVVDGAKFVIGSVLIPMIGLVAITAVEKDITFTGSLKDYAKFFLPKRN